MNKIKLDKKRIEEIIDLLVGNDLDRLNGDGHFFLKEFENTPKTQENFIKLQKIVNNLDLVSYDRVSSDGKAALDDLCHMFMIEENPMIP